MSQILTIAHHLEVSAAFVYAVCGTIAFTGAAAIVNVLT